MDWASFQRHGEAPTRSFEAFVNQLFENWCREEFSINLLRVVPVNGAGGDGGVEAYATLSDNSTVGVQSKWFLTSLGNNEMTQIRNSVRTAKGVRPSLKRYIVALPRDLASIKAGNKRSEEDRWNALMVEMTKEFPDLQIELWNESRLLNELQKDGSGGIYRYWFTKEEISLTSIQHQFQKAKSGWLRQRYIPSLHGQGVIHDGLLRLLGERNYRQRVYKMLSDELKHVRDSIEEIRFAVVIFDTFGLTKELQQVIKSLTHVESNLVHLLSCTKTGDRPSPLKLTDEIDLQKCIRLVETMPLKSIYSINRNDLIRTLKGLDVYEMNRKLEEAHKSLIEQKLIFLGGPGTGKTHGLANLVDVHVEKLHKPALIIQAKRFTATSTWGDILTDVLGLSKDWSEDAIWTALDACAIRCDVRDATSDDSSQEVLIEPTKVLLCIDGLDESIPYEPWLERIAEMDAVLRVHHRLRVAITSRPHVFDHTDKAHVTLPSEGDRPTYELFGRYIEHYNIQFDVPTDHAWLKWSLKTPFALRLFCEKYKDSVISQSTDLHTLTEHLLADKIQSLDEEINRRLNNPWRKIDNAILKILLAISDHCIDVINIERQELCELVVECQGRITPINSQSAFTIIDCLVEFGLMYETTMQPKAPLEVSKTYYEIATQPLMDYLLAIRLVRDTVENNMTELPETLKYRRGAQQMGAIILLQDHDWFIGEKNLWVNSLSRSDLFDLQLFTLSHVSVVKTIRFVELVEQSIPVSMPVCRRISNDLVARVARVNGHPLGPRLLHKVLMAYETVAKRDIFWSVPEFMGYRNEHVWDGSGDCVSSNTTLGLISSDKHDGLPLIYAWQLTVVDNKVRNKCRQQLTTWGIENPQEFIRLIKLTFQTNDPQMKEDLMSCAMGVASALNGDSLELRELTSWVLSNVFAEDKIIILTNAIIRAAGRAIAERAYFFGLIAEDQVALARPPYQTDPILIEIDEEAARTTGEMYTPVTADLAWYVIKDVYTPFFFREPVHPYQHTKKEEDICWDDIPSSVLQRALEEGLEGDEREQATRLLHEREQRANFHANWIAAVEQAWAERLKKSTDIEFDGSQPHDDVEHIQDITGDPQGYESESTNIQQLYSSEAEDLLKTYAACLGVVTITPHQFTLGAVIAYLYKMGWVKDTFYGVPNGGKSGEILGLDVAIVRQYGPATHGSQSPIMQFSEKYTWLAVHELIGYLSDILPFRDPSNTVYSRVEDYLALVDVPNPLQEVWVKSMDQVRSETGWFLPNDLSPELSECQDHTPATLEKWIKSAPEPDFKDWLTMQGNSFANIAGDLGGNWVCLYNFSAVTEARTKGTSLLWIQSLLIADEDMHLLQHDCVSGSEILTDKFINGHNLTSSPKTDTYVSPSALSWMNWIYDEYVDLSIHTFHNTKIQQYSLKKCLSDVTYSSIEEREVSFMMPSKKVRDLLQISSGNGWRYFDDQMRKVCFYSTTGTPYRDGQTLLYANKSSLDIALKDNQLKMVWVVRLLREPSVKARDSHEFYYRKDRTWLAYMDGDKVQMHLIVEQCD